MARSFTSFCVYSPRFGGMPCSVEAGLRCFPEAIAEAFRRLGGAERRVLLRCCVAGEMPGGDMEIDL